MNQRILMLAASHFPRDSDGNICATPDIIAEFAESIVRECALQCIHNEDMDRIEKHFGVE